MLLCVGLHQGSQIEFISPLPPAPLPPAQKAQSKHSPGRCDVCEQQLHTRVYTCTRGTLHQQPHRQAQISTLRSALLGSTCRKPEAPLSIDIEGQRRQRKGCGDARLPNFHGALVGWRCPTRILSWCASHTYAGGLVGGPTHCFAPFGSLLPAVRTWTASSPDSRDPKAASSSGALIWQ